ncbi:MAG: Glu-tRNA(Gln) amidotransferase subunit GatD [Candidatus Nezhaarchaeota archaeon]|nr:Glu-tRNA(Gln) amidotransferase subunit GatD [Candidatus Nezhaarchaeota archaeon]
MEEAGYWGRALELIRSIGASVYDRVRVQKGQVSLEGLLMPPADPSDDKHLVLKLDSGYNAGVRIDRGVTVELLAKGPSYRPALPEVPMRVKEGLPRVAIVSTGGTIASRVDYVTGAVYPALSARDLYSVVPELGDVANLEAEVLISILSEDMHPSLWAEVAKSVALKIEGGVDGVVVTHGTDTMSYTAAALSFALQDLPVPIVLVGSQRSSDRPSSDAAMNLMSAVAVASRAPFAEVVVVMHGSISDTYALVHRGTRVRKCHTSRRDAFKSINSPPLAKVEEGRVELLSRPLRDRDRSRRVKLSASFEEKVALVKIHPGLDGSIIDYLVDRGFRGIVLEGTGLGHAPHAVFSSIERAVDSGLVVVMTSQCLWGRVNMNVYRTGVELLKMGVLPGGDMLPEVALVKLMWCLGQSRDVEEVKKLMLTNLAGELQDITRFSDYPGWS